MSAIVPQRTYYAVYAALVLLTISTVAVALVPLPERWHAVAGLAIAVLKAALVVLFFMHLLYSSQLTRLFLGGGLVWLGIMIVLTLTDYLTRGWLPGA